MKLLKKLLGSKNDREIKKMWKTVRQVNAFEPILVELTDDQIKAKTTEFRQRVSEGESLDQLLPEAFAVVREAARRTLGLRHFDGWADAASGAHCGNGHG